MKKLLIIGLVGAGLIAFVGTDVFSSAVTNARNSLRARLTSDVPLPQQLAEAHAQIDAYAENIIKGEVAAENLKDMISDVEREVRALTVRVDHERGALVAYRERLETAGRDGEIVAASIVPVGDDGAGREALRHVRTFRTANEMLARRTSDLARLQDQYAATQQSLRQARAERVRLSEEARVLAAEVASLNARKAAARTRQAVGDASVSRSGFARAHERLQKIRSALSEQNKLLQYYELRRDMDAAPATEGIELFEPADANQAIEEALASYPAR